MSLPFNLAFSGLSSGLQTKNAAAGGGVGGWVELGRTTLGSTADTISVASLADKRYYMILADQRASGDTNSGFRLNGDTGSNYAQRGNFNGTENTATSNSTLMGNWGSAVSTKAFHVGYLANKSDKEKLAIIHKVTQSTAGAGTAPNRQEGVGKHAQTSVAINAVSVTNTDSGDYASGSELVVLGWDPADTHTTNFWTELASVDLSGGAASYIDSGTITAKKYLWYQIYSSQTIDSDFIVTFNADSTLKYNRRYSYNGATDVYSDINLAGYPHTSNAANTPSFFNAFVINNLANEKLIMSHDIMRYTAGAGIAPNRLEGVGKWENTSAQITSMRVTSGSGNLNTNTYLRIWGSN